MNLIRGKRTRLLGALLAVTMVAGMSAGVNAQTPAPYVNQLMTAAEIRGKQRGRPFRKGQSGNPGGRPKESKAFKEWCHQIMAKEGRDGLLALARAADDERVRLNALRLIAEYAYGKPTQSVDATLNGNVGLANFLALAFEESGAGSTRSVDAPDLAAGEAKTPIRLDDQIKRRRIFSPPLLKVHPVTPG